MRRGFFLFLLTAIWGTNFVFAGGAPKIAGEWFGSFVAIYNTGETLALDNGIATIYQSDMYPNLFYGTMEFIIEMGEGEDPLVISSFLTGYIGEDKRISIQLTPQEYDPEDILPIPATGIIEGHLTGKTIKGVVRDFTDTTTTMFVATREGSAEMEPESETQNVPRGRAKGRSK